MRISDWSSDVCSSDLATQFAEARVRSASVGIAQIITGTALGLALLYFLRSILVPFVIAFVLALLVDALVRSIVRRRPKAPGWADRKTVVEGTSVDVRVTLGGSRCRKKKKKHRK